MKYLFLVLCLAFASTVIADGLSYTSMTAGIRPATSGSSVAVTDSGTDALTYYTDESTFDAANPGLITEDFSSTLIAANAVGSDAGAINYLCNNSLFALHTIVDGISLWEQSNNDMVVLGLGFMGVTNVTVGPNSFADDAIITFTVPTRAFGTFMVMPNGGDVVNIEVFGASGSLGTTSHTGGTGAGTFWGVFCNSEDITYITFNDPNDAGELFADVRFGLPTSLSRTTWASVKASF